MNGKSKRQSPSKMFNNMELNHDDQSTVSMPAYTPRSSYDAEYGNVDEIKFRLLQLGPEMIQVSSTLRDRLRPGDPMIAAWDGLISTLQKGCETPTLEAVAATPQVLSTEEHATKHAPFHEPSHTAETNQGPVQRLCDHPSNINSLSESGHEGVKTGVKRSYCESVVSDTHFSGSVTGEHLRGGADGPDLPTSNAKCICKEVGNWEGCKYCLKSKGNIDKSTCDAWSLYGYHIDEKLNNDQCTCGGWDGLNCNYCRDAKVEPGNDPWNGVRAQWSPPTAGAPERRNTRSPAVWNFDALPSPAIAESRYLSPTPNTRHATSVPAADPQKQSEYSVTYWATIKYGEQGIDVPIDSDYVSGPEKGVIEGVQGMQMVWDWVVKKGLDNLIGLQDAFDLAMDMRKGLPPGFFYDTEGDVDFEWSVKAESDCHRSRRGPLSAKRARLSPTPSDRYSLSVASDILSR